MREQFQELILDLISKVLAYTSPCRTRLTVIDALDECKCEEDVQVLIK